MQNVVAYEVWQESSEKCTIFRTLVHPSLSNRAAGVPFSGIPSESNQTGSRSVTLSLLLLIPLAHSSKWLLMAAETQLQVYYVASGRKCGTDGTRLNRVPAIYNPAEHTVTVFTGDFKVKVELDVRPKTQQKDAKSVFDQQEDDDDESPKCHATIWLNRNGSCVKHDGVCVSNELSLHIDCIVDENAPGYDDVMHGFWLEIGFPRAVALGKTPCSSSSTTPAV